ncbi:MAG: AAA domain-containing protein [Candidatus Peribacteraceae bacterium]|nr:AAA domain-containing protein [Candidatus Peribacteraceae bacterium]MDD5743036.1 AAA domain-containing protein [Candidatus Peribacteraceae bacterium]
MSDIPLTTAENQTYEIEENYPRQLTSAEIGEIRSKTYNEALHVMDGSAAPPWAEQPGAPAPVIQIPNESWDAAYGRREQMHRQLNVSIRHLDELLEIDDQVSGNPDRGTQGIRLPVLRLGQRGKHHAVIRTQNTWGSIPIEEDMELQGRLKAQCMQPDANGTPVLDQEAYRRALREYQRDHANADLPVLGEDDRVDIFDAEEEHIGSGVVREVAGDTIRLHFHTPVRLKKGCFLRKRSNRRALETYKEYVHEYCEKLRCTGQMTNRAGDLFLEPSLGEHGKPKRERRNMYSSPERGEERYDPNFGRYPYRSYYNDHSASGFWAEQPARLSHPEQFFFSEEGGTEREQTLRNFALGGVFEQEDIPREILDDDEQCAAFALGAMGHPCMLIQGPPGTGKTTVASLLAKRFQEEGKKTLILSHSNRGLDTLLLAARKKHVALHRGGTEERSCDRRLRDTFIRKGLKYPRRVEYLVPVFDHKAFEKAQQKHDPDSGESSPTREDFTHMELDKEQWNAAWDAFEQQKRLLLQNLQKERGLTVGVTLNSLISDEIIQELNFDVVIVDEASKGFLYEFLPALKKAGKQIIFIGDHKQLGNIDLPPVLKKHLEDPAEQQELTVEENPNAIREADVTIFEGGPFKYFAEQEAIPQVMLRTNRRALKDLVRVVSFGSYDGKLKAGRRDHTNPENTGSLLWVDTAGRPDREESSSGVSRVNRLQARLVARRLMDEFERGELSQGDFGVIAMYRAQVNLILRQARKAHPKHGGIREQFLETLRGRVATVDSFQGSERDTISLTTDRSNEEGNVGFLDDVRRTNVAGSRARDRLVVYGDRKTLIDDNPDPESAAYFRVLYEICEQRGQVISVFPSLPGQVRPESEKIQTRNARWKRRRHQIAKRKAAEQIAGE